jgi:GT2 family glycosyltransferase
LKSDSSATNAARVGGPRFRPLISVVIPAFNEERYLALTLASVRRYMGDAYPYEVVVVDNGSTDRTVQIAQQSGARVEAVPTGTVSALRNRGTRLAQGEIVFYLDADVELTEEWSRHWPATVQALREDPSVLAGSWYGIAEPGTWIERHWFGPLVEGEITHLCGGHMILRHELFDRIGGFDEALATGEDYDFCMRAKAAGAGILNNPRLHVIHNGYPKTLRAFVRREMWHGQGDFLSLRTVRGSKVALATLVFLACHLVILTSPGLSYGPAIAGFGAMGILGLCIVSAIKKYPRAGVTTFVVNTFLFYFYYLGRSLSLFLALSPWGRRKRRRG